MAKSSTEAEVVAINESLVWSTYPLTGVLDEIYGQVFPWVLHVDNDAARLVAMNGASNISRYMAQHQRINFAFLKDAFDSLLHEGSREVVRCDSITNVADIMTKALGRVAFERHRLACGVEPRPATASG